MKWVYLYIAIGTEVTATIALRASEGFTRPGPSALVVAGYAAAFYFLSLTLNTIPVGIAYAIWSGAGILLTAIAGWRLFGQTIDLPGLIGIGLILAGVAVINLLSGSSAG
jgi:small multidrug resistance pump